MEDSSLDSKNYLLKLESFFGNLSYRFKIYEHTKKDFDLYLASDQDKVLETKISYLLSFLLKTRESHGQGSIFHDLFVKKLNEYGSLIVTAPKGHQGAESSI